MLKLSPLFFTFLSLTLLAKTPQVFSALGDVIYNNSSKIEKLSLIKEYTNDKDRINKYIQDVNKTKKDGFLIEEGDKTIDKKKYLSALRYLSKINDYFIQSAKENFRQSLKEENNLLFIQLVNSGLINTIKHKDIMLKYYYDHKQDINASGVIQSYLDEDQALCDLHEKQRRNRKTKATLQKEKIERIRSKDKKEQENLERKLNNELTTKKLEIRKTQTDELFN